MVLLNIVIKMCLSVEDPVQRLVTVIVHIRCAWLLVALTRECLNQIQADILGFIRLELSPVEDDLRILVPHLVEVNELIVHEIIQHLEVDLQAGGDSEDRDNHEETLVLVLVLDLQLVGEELPVLSWSPEGSVPPERNLEVEGSIALGWLSVVVLRVEGVTELETFGLAAKDVLQRVLSVVRD